VQARVHGKNLPTVEIVKDSDSDVYENVDISESDDICEIEESDPTVSESLRMGSGSDRSSEETVLQTQQGRGQKRIHDTKSKCIIGNCEFECKRK
jgi:hypothetical protein